MRLRIASSSSSICVEVREGIVSGEEVEDFADGGFWVTGGALAD